MADAARMCQVDSCKRGAATLCYHCQQEVCHKHFTEHSLLMMTDVYSLADRINTMAESITTFSITHMRDSLFKQLQQWRDESINRLENVFKQKKIELDAKIGELDTILILRKAEKQQEVLQIKQKINELMDAGEATFDQVNRLRKLVDQIAVDVDKLRISPIRIETQPVNLETCLIIHMNQASHTQSEDVSVSLSMIHIGSDVRHFIKQTDHSHSSSSESMVTIKNSSEASSIPISGSLTIPHAPRSPATLLPPIPLPPLLSPYPLLPLPPGLQQMPIPFSNTYSFPESISPQRPTFTSPPYPTNDSLPHIFTPPPYPIYDSLPHIFVAAITLRCS